MRERQVGFVFQHYALFRHMSVFENIAFGLRVRPRRGAAVRGGDPRHGHGAAAAWCSSTCWPSAARRSSPAGSASAWRWPARWRSKPKVLLLDEPFGALDAKVRKELRRWLRRLHDEVHVTSVFVTHDQEEALEVADRVVVMNEGRIEQSGTPEEVYEHPATPFVYGFLGDVNLFHGRIHQGRVDIGGEQARRAGVGRRAGPGGRGLRPHLRSRAGPGAVGRLLAQAVVRHIRAFGPVVRLELDLVDGGRTIEAHIPRARFDSMAITKGQHGIRLPDQRPGLRRAGLSRYVPRPRPTVRRHGSCGPGGHSHDLSDQRRLARSREIGMLPNFIVIGAAKAGTTSLHWYLAEHPAVFMTPTKDPSYFAYGLDARGQLLVGRSGVPRFPVKSLAEYERLFEDVGGATAVGEASTMYLECPQSAGRIREMIPQARILCSIRHPVDRAYSDYLMYLRRRGRRFRSRTRSECLRGLGPSRLPLDADRPVPRAARALLRCLPARADPRASLRRSPARPGRVHPGRLSIPRHRSGVRPRLRYSACARAGYR